MTILLTGAQGYIGSHIVGILKKKYHILTPTHKQLNLLDADATRRYFLRHKIAIVIHAALVGGSRREQYVKGMFLDNMTMFFNVVRNHDRFGRLIHIGSGSEYDKRYPIINIKEKDFDKRIPAGELGLYKYLCAKYIESVDFAVNLRVFGIYGPGEDYRLRFISNAICRSVQGKPITISRNVYFDYIYVKDFVKIIDYFLKHKSKYKSYNIGTGKKIDLLSLAKKINAIAPTPQPIRVSHKGLQNEYTCDTTRLYKEVKQSVNTPMDIALQEVYDWYAIHKNSLNTV